MVELDHYNTVMIVEAELKRSDPPTFEDEPGILGDPTAEADPTAKALGCVEDASKTADAKHKAGADCSNCQFYSGGATGRDVVLAVHRGRERREPVDVQEGRLPAPAGLTGAAGRGRPHQAPSDFRPLSRLWQTLRLASSAEGTLRQQRHPEVLRRAPATGGTARRRPPRRGPHLNSTFPHRG